MTSKTGKWKFKSGFCADGNHEGTKPVSASGQPMKICEFWETCPCKCHADITAMYEAVGMDREPPEQSAEYLAKVHANDAATRQMLDEVYAMTTRSRSLSNLDGTDAQPDPEDAPTGTQDAPTTPSRAIPKPVFAATPTGRRARGQLEYDVLQICHEFSKGVYDWEACTPKNVAERIGKLNDTEPPSTGAISAVWDRWEKIGFAEQAKKPLRFVQFTGDSSPVRLDRLKAEIKRTARRSQAEQRRGSLRPRGR